MTAGADRRWAAALRRRLPDLSALALTALVADRVAAELGLAPVAHDADGPGAGEAGRGAPAGWDQGHDPPTGWGDPWLVGLVHEQAAAPADRKARGAWYTPRSVVTGLSGVAFEVAFEAAGGLPALVIDPTCGGGAFLLAALDRLRAGGLDPEDAVARVRGVDLDPTAVAATRWGVRLWVGARLRDDGRDPASARDLGPDVRLGDVLADGTALQPDSSAPAGPLVVVGNPPFATPLRTGAVPATAEGVRRDHPDLLGPYAGLGAIHLLHVLRSLPVDRASVVALVEPHSLLAGRDTAGLRAVVDGPGAFPDRAVTLDGLWAARESLFDAGVRPCAPVLSVRPTGPPAPAERPSGPDAAGRSALDGPVEADDGTTIGRPGAGVGVDAGVGVGVGVDAGGGRGRDRGWVRLYRGASVLPYGRRRPDAWAGLAADALGAPRLPRLGPATLGDLAEATAGFRDEHYALVAACREVGSDDGHDPDLARVVTVGSVDPLWHDWGVRPYRFGGATWVRPVVERAALPDRVARWLHRLHRPKVLLATQARLLEPVIDRDGSVAPATPLIAVTADPDALDRVAAVLLAPPVVLWAWRRWFGTALSVDAVKLAARQVGELPLPTDEGAWAEAAAVVAAADGVSDIDAARDRARVVARLMNRAYGADGEVLAWWDARLRRRSEPANR